VGPILVIRDFEQEWIECLTEVCDIVVQWLASLFVNGDEESVLRVTWTPVFGQPVAYDLRVPACESLASLHVDKVCCRAATDELSDGWCPMHYWFVWHRTSAGDCPPASLLLIEI
jgi:hypothetical protein